MKLILTITLNVLIVIMGYGQNIHSSLTETWIDNAWQNQYQFLNTYDGNDFLTLSYYQTWNPSSNIWKNGSKTTYTNNDYAKPKLSITQSWDNTTGIWKNSYKTTNTFNSENKISSVFNEIWDVDHWENSYKFSNTYDDSSYLINDFNQIWDSGISSWLNSRKGNYTNNSSGKPLISSYQTWDNSSSSWVNSQKVSYTYNTENKVITILHEIWKDGIWQYWVEYSYTYDENNIETNGLAKTWNVDSDIWENTNQWNNTYNNSDLLYVAVNQNWNSSTSYWDNFNKTTNTYLDFLSVSEDIVNISSQSNNSINISIFSNINWTIVSNQSWLTINTSTGLDNATIILTATANPAATDRTANVTISDGTMTKIITIVQSSSSPILTVSTNTLIIEETIDNQGSFEISSNTSWTVTSNQTWLSTDIKKGSGNSTITLSATLNSETINRSATISVITDEISEIINVTQKGTDASMTVSTDSLIIEGVNNSEATFKINSNTSWAVTSNQDWLTINSTTGSGNSTIILIAKTNSTPSNRIAIITVTSETFSEIVIVTQNVNTTEVDKFPKNTILLYPNPVHSIINIKYAKPNSIISIYDVSGKLVYSKQMNKKKEAINIGNLRNGVYFIKFDNHKKKITYRFIKN